MKRRVKILDCTLRDGGLGLEDANKSNRSYAEFRLNELKEISEKLTDAYIDIIELGSIELSEDDKKGFAIYKSIEEISKKIPVKKKADQLFTALYRGPDTPVEDIPNWKPGLCDAVRVIIRYSELQKSLDFCAELSKKGYLVFIQPMLTMRYTDAELQRIFEASNQMNAYAVYFVDSYGYMLKEDIIRLFRQYDDNLKPEIKVGFHAHNNMNLAFSNALVLLEQETDRDIIIDSCAIGMGQGAGNLQTEIITDYLNHNMGMEYNYIKILEVCEMIEPYCEPGLWGYSVTRFISAACRTAYKFAVSLRNYYQLSYVEIYTILQNVPEDIRHRYTPENTMKLLELNGYKGITEQITVK